MNQVLTWKDFVLLLSGYPTREYTRNLGDCGLRANMNDEGVQNNTYWGTTLGTPAGREGRPLCECKLLDESLFYYNNYSKDIWTWTGINQGFQWNDSCIYACYYEQKWQYWYTRDNIATGVNLGDIKLEPGVYIAVAVVYYNGFSKFRFRDPAITGPSQWTQFLMNIDGPTWTSQIAAGNMMFFVDSTVYMGWNGYGAANKSAAYMGRIYRITPPGYWHL